MGVEPKIGVVLVFTPEIIHLFIGFGSIIFTIHFGGFYPYFLETPISILIVGMIQFFCWKTVFFKSDDLVAFQEVLGRLKGTRPALSQ